MSEDLNGGEESIIEFRVSAFDESGGFEGRRRASEDSGDQDADERCEEKDGKFCGKTGCFAAGEQHGNDGGQEQYKPGECLAAKEPEAEDSTHHERQFSFQTATAHGTPLSASQNTDVWRVLSSRRRGKSKCE